jgi:two-component system alkaline phosphatase synthesis response regulator PhoP
MSNGSGVSAVRSHSSEHTGGTTAIGRILLVEDEAGLVMTISDRLRAEGYAVEHSGDGESGFELARKGGFDLIILDLMLPKRGGMDVCRGLRQLSVDTPILMLTARSQVVDKIVGLQLGADDYLTKPFEMLELLARIDAILRRTRRPSAAAGGLLRFGKVTVNFATAEVLRDGQPVQLSAREFHLLRYLVERRGEVVSREELLRAVWGYTAEIETRTVDVHITWLRQKLETNPKAPELIVTLRGLGYKFAG